MARLKLIQIPLDPPFSKGDFFLQRFKPLFGKEGKGRFWGSRAGIN
jgi:hypothetical protein